MGEIIDLPSNDGPLDLDAKRQREQDQQIAAEIRDAERGVRVRRRIDG